ncbi:MAG: hypothetical protein Q9169_001545 [Polycauliona sp. 2 TL-2023]
MSELQRSFAKAKLAGLPLEPPLPLDAFREDDEYAVGLIDDAQSLPESPQEEDSSSASSASSASSTGTIKPNLEEVVIHHVYFTPPENSGPLFVLHHGAGSSGLSFAAFAMELRKALPDAGVMSMEARGHGETVVTSKDGIIKREPHDMSITLLSSDLSDAVNLIRTKLGWAQLPDIILVGHSLGGAIITEVASRRTLGNAVLGYAVLDVVEGSAMDALQQMNMYLARRPRSFASLTSAIDWHLSARVSVPPLLCQKLNSSLDASSQPWTWRTDLLMTEEYWGSWFAGLSTKFLEAKGGKLLILAGTDRLDKELMIGQMQGKSYAPSAIRGM